MSDAPPDSDPDAAPEEAESSRNASEEASEDAPEDAPAEFTQDPDRVVATANTDRAPAAKPAADSPADARTDLEDLKRQIYELNDQNSQVSDLARRLKAEMANMRRRMDLDKATLRARLVEQICADFLPLLDDLQRAAVEAARTGDDAPEAEAGESGKAPPTAAADEALRTGVRLVARRFEESLAKQGFVEIEALGHPFDPRHHEAVHRLPATEGQEDGEIVEVYRRGYFLGDRVVRPATVVVAYHPDPATAPPVPDTGPETGAEAAPAQEAEPTPETGSDEDPTAG